MYSGVACSSQGWCMVTSRIRGDVCRIDMNEEEAPVLLDVIFGADSVALIKNDTRLVICQANGGLRLNEEILIAGKEKERSCDLALDERGSAVLKRAQGTTVFYSAHIKRPVLSIDRSLEGEILDTQEATNINAMSITFDAARGQLLALSQSGQLYVASPRVIGAATAAATRLEATMTNLQTIQWLGASDHGFELDGIKSQTVLEMKRRQLKNRFSGQVLAANNTHLALLHLPGPRENHALAIVTDIIQLSRVQHIAVYDSSFSIRIAALIEDGSKLALLRIKPKIHLDRIIQLPANCENATSVDNRTPIPSISPKQSLTILPTSAPTKAIIRDLDDDDIIAFLNNDHAQKPTINPMTPVPTIFLQMNKEQQPKKEQHSIIFSQQPGTTKRPFFHIVTFLFILAALAVTFAIRRCRTRLSNKFKTHRRRSGAYDRLSTSPSSEETRNRRKQQRRRRTTVASSIFSLSYWRRLLNGSNHIGPYEPLDQQEKEDYDDQEDEEEEDNDEIIVHNNIK
uniref:Uncharacterized protein n=1 Tax=Aureoumbra lagunensis TaxID=44058 RepID=A0A7S3JPV8_9STRA